MNRFFKLLAIIVVFIIGYSTYLYIKEKTTDWEHKVVLCIPVYGQSYALGEEAKRITNFDSLRIKYNGRIVTEHMDYEFGYFDHSSRLKQYIKRLLHYDKKAFELSVYGMAEYLASHLGKDTMICIFPGGLGQVPLYKLEKPAKPYRKFIEEIEYAYKKAKKRGWDFNVPAICWMQGESDIVDYPDTDYKVLFMQMYDNLNTEIKQITGQENDIRIILYQSNIITKAKKYKPNNYNCEESRTPEIQMEFVRDDSMIWASGPVYHYSFVNEFLHIDAVSQKRIGSLAGRSIFGLINNEKRYRGVIPIKTTIINTEVHIAFNVPYPPLCFDTIAVKKAANYGFNVIRRDNIDIISDVVLNQDTVIIKCKESPQDCKIRYAINGEIGKCGWRIGPRGNLRDSQGLSDSIIILGKSYPQHNWCYQFDLP